MANQQIPPHTKHAFRYLIKPGTDFAFTSKFRLWVALSLILSTIAIGSLFVNKATRGEHLNWTIDFKGGTEIIYKFRDKADPTKYVAPDAAKVRDAIAKAGDAGFDVSGMSWKEDTAKGEVEVHGVLVRTPRFGATTPVQQTAALEAFGKKFADRGVASQRWSGDRLFVRATSLITDAEAAPVFVEMGLEVREGRITRDQLWLADEVFFTGTAAEVTPVREIDNRPIGDGGVGPITKRVQERFFGVVKGSDTSHSEWLTSL